MRRVPLCTPSSPRPCVPSILPQPVAKTPPLTILRRYFDAWNAPDTDTRLRLVYESCTDGVVYLDPQDAVRGRIALVAYMDAFRARTPHRLEPTAQAQLHHDVARFPWRLADPEHGVLATGELVADFGPDGPLTRIVHFVDTPAT